MLDNIGPPILLTTLPGSPVSSISGCYWHDVLYKDISLCLYFCFVKKNEKATLSLPQQSFPASFSPLFSDGLQAGLFSINMTLTLQLTIDLERGKESNPHTRVIEIPNAHQQSQLFFHLQESSFSFLFSHCGWIRLLSSLQLMIDTPLCPSKFKHKM